MTALTKAQQRLLRFAQLRGWTTTEERATTGALIALNFTRTGNRPINVVYHLTSQRVAYARQPPTGGMVRNLDLVRDWLNTAADRSAR